MSQMKEQDKTPEEQTKWSGDRESTWKRIQSNDSKYDPRSWKKNGGTEWDDTRNVYDLELKNRDEQYNKRKDKYTVR